ncbi:MAG: UDP-N-acetylmuramoyl-L-alanine--D-glutamate ligase [bacterium]|jgi:UDP-N-acetylmuramoylalanine--D-glutamate ligase
MNLLANKTVLVIGLAKSGYAAATALAKRGVKTIATDIKDDAAIKERAALLEDKGAKVVLGQHPLELLAAVNLVVVSPGVPDTAPLVAEAKRRSIPVISEPELAYCLYPGPYLAITGSNGKTTTTAWVGEALTAGGVEVVVAGNIGRPLTEAVSHVSPNTWVVAELSSFQLEYIDQFRPRISTILNLSEDHLDRHGSFAAYRAAKAKIFACQNKYDVLVLNADDKYSAELAAVAPSRVLFFSRRQLLTQGAWVEEGNLTIGFEGEKVTLCRQEEVAIPGHHNLENALATACLARAAGVPPAAISWALQHFSGVEHRCEKVANIGGVLYVNDSKGTNPDATVRALQAFSPPLILIAGGRDKGTSLQELVTVAKDRCRAVILIGEAAPKFKQALTAGGFSASYEADTLPAAVRMAHDLALTGDTVLLSPACASFDMFHSYEQRGLVFKEVVGELGGDRA